MDINRYKQLFHIGGSRLLLCVMTDRVLGTHTQNKVYLSIDEKKYPEIVEWLYQQQTGKPLNLTNPKTFNEKVNWLKLYDRDPLKTQLSDKYEVRSWIKEMIGEQYLIPLINVWDSFDDIDFDLLPDRFVLKCNHGCAWNILVRDKRTFDKAAAKKKMDSWMQRNYAFPTFELQYKDIRPKIIAEEYIEQLDGNLYDYKFHCFGGVPKLIEVIGDREFGTHNARAAIMKMDWTRNEGVSLQTMPQMLNDPQKPESFDEMVKIAAKLSAGFPYVRVDLYDVAGKVLFGEMTFSPANGTDPTDEYFTYADLIKLPSQME